MKLLKGYSKQETSWMMYDWANSAHSVIVVTILPIFYNTVAEYTGDAVSSMSTWGYATSAAMAIVALLAPVLGVFGDFEGWRKKLFTGFMLVGVVSCLGLAAAPALPFTQPGVAERVGLLVLSLYILSTLGFAGANLYYDSFLTDVTTEERMDQVSTMGYGLGYIGGSTIPLLIFLIMNAVGVPMLTCLSFIFGFTGVWWLVFSFPMLKNVHQASGVPREKGAVGKALRGLGGTLKEIAAHKDMLVYLLAYFFYIDGVNTIIHMSTTYGDMLRVPGSTPGDSLQRRRAMGARVQMVYSPVDAVQLAKENPDKQVVFLGVGFETTAPGTAAAALTAAEQRVENFSLWSMLKTVEPALRALMAMPDFNIDGFICPGHVATIIGVKGFRFLPVCRPGGDEFFFHRLLLRLLHKDTYKSAADTRAFAPAGAGRRSDMP